MMIRRTRMGTAQLTSRGRTSMISMVFGSFHRSYQQWLSSSSKIPPLEPGVSSGSAFDFECQTFHRRDLDKLSLLDRRIAYRVPVFALDKDAAAARIDWG